MGSVDGKNVLITGGSHGMGLVTAQMLVDAGARVLLVGRDQAALDAATAGLGDRAVAVRADVSSLADLNRLADRAKDELGTLDALFVNAGVARMDSFDSMSEAMYDEVFATNAKGSYFTVQKLAPVLSDGAAVVLTTSMAAAKADPGSSAYAASKAALGAMTRSLAAELLPRRIRVNAISPGPIDSGAAERSMTPEAAEQAREYMAGGNPMGRMGTCEEIAKAFVFLAFDATYTTGFELAVDGGASRL